jgi:DNA repair protein RadC
MEKYGKIYDSMTLCDALSIQSGKPYGPCQLPKDERPREKLREKGHAVLTDRELLSVMLNSGIQGKNVFAIADELLDLIDSSKTIPSMEKLMSIAGMGESKACGIQAMLEFGRRRWGPCEHRIKGASELYTLIRHYADSRQERFIGISLSGSHEILGIRNVTVGLVNKTIIHPREVFADPIADRASCVVIAHNHPSGTLTPSPEDDEITRQILRAGFLLGVPLVDHIVFTTKGFYSYANDNRMPDMQD